MALTESILVLLAGCCDRVRGGFPTWKVFGDRPEAKPAWVDHARHAGKYVYGMVLAAVVTDVWWLIVLAGPAWKFGEQFSSPVGSWSDQFDIYRDRGGWLAVLQVSALWPVLTALLGFAAWALTGQGLELALLVPASIIGAPAGLFLSRYLVRVQLPLWALELRSAPAWGEVLRGVGVGAAAAWLA